MFVCCCLVVTDQVRELGRIAHRHKYSYRDGPGTSKLLTLSSLDNGKCFPSIIDVGVFCNCIECMSAARGYLP